MVPLSEAGARDDRDGWMISDSWYIGAFGKWWRGGVLENWYQDVIARSKDEESWSSGILSMKSLDMLQDFNGRLHLFPIIDGPMTNVSFRIYVLYKESSSSFDQRISAQA